MYDPILFDAAVNGNYLLFDEDTVCGAEIVPFLSESSLEYNETACSTEFHRNKAAKHSGDMDFIVDSGASINIMSTKSNHLLSNINAILVETGLFQNTRNV